jgi:hypothetical protein
MISLDTPEVSQYFASDRYGNWQCKQTAFVIRGAILDFYKHFGATGLRGLTHLGLPQSNEVYPLIGEIQPTVAVAVQKFERAIVANDPEYRLDNPPGADSTYLMHLDVTMKCGLRFDGDNWYYHGITSTWKHIGITYDAIHTMGRDADGKDIPLPPQAFDPDWWEAHMPRKDVWYFDPWKDWRHRGMTLPDYGNKTLADIITIRRDTPE